MPIYQFICKNKECSGCDQESSELLAKPSEVDDSVPLCSICHTPMTRQLGMFGKHLSWASWRTDLEAGRKKR